MITLSKDELWKGAIEDLIVPFIKFFFPENVSEINWSKPIEFLDTELPKIIRGLRSGKKTADRLIKVYLKNGKAKFFMIHVEVQSQEDLSLSDRMFKMFYRIYDRFNVDVTALAIIAYKGARENGIYKQNFWGTKIEYTFNVFNLLKEVEKGAIDNDNIFSLIIRSVYLDIKFGENELAKFEGKIKLLEDFLKRKPSHEEYQVLLNFILMFVRLNGKMDQKVENFINHKQNISNKMGINDLIKSKYEKALLKKEKALLQKDEALLQKDEALLQKDEALLQKDESYVTNSFINGISIPLIVNITSLSTKEVKAILKKNNLI